MKLLLLLANISSATAFVVGGGHQRHVIKPLYSTELSPIDEICIENVAEFCLHESCDIEEYEALINQLEEQKSHFIRKVRVSIVLSCEFVCL